MNAGSSSGTKNQHKRKWRKAKGEALPQPPLVLVVEDEYFLKADLEQILNDAGFATETVSSGEEALALFEADQKNMTHSSPMCA